MSKRIACNFLLLIAGSFIALWVLSSVGFLKSFELRASDELFTKRRELFGIEKVSPFVVHVDIDDASVRKLGTSVERGERYRKIIDILTEAEVGSIIFDMLFAKSDVAGTYKEQADLTRYSGRVYYPVILRRQEPDEDLVNPDTRFPSNLLWHVNVLKEGVLSEAAVMLPTTTELTDVARGVGHITCYADREDGIYRRFPLLFKHGDGYIPGISFRAVCDYLKVPPERIDVRFGSDIVLRGAEFPDGRKKDITIPIDQQGKMIINFAGQWSETNTEYFAHYSLAALFDAGEDDMKFDDLIDGVEESLVVVADISGGRDLGATPLEDSYHLPGIHTNVISSILTGQFIDELSRGQMMAVDAVLVMLLFLAALRFRASVYAVAVGAIVVAYFAGWAALFLYQSMLTDFVRPFLAMILALVAVNVHKFLIEETAKAALRAKFEHYFAPSLLEKILRSPAMLETREKKPISILFSDIKGFTAWSSTRQPEEIHGTLNQYFEAMAEIVFKHDGTIDKYIGDGLMVFFGDPIEHKDHALRAVKAAIEMQQKVRELRAKWEPEGRMAIEIRIGINTGDCVVGNMGSEKRVDYTAIGAHVNLAQRLESNGPVGGVLISDSVQDGIKGEIETHPAGTIQAKGFDTPIAVHEVLVPG